MKNIFSSRYIITPLALVALMALLTQLASCGKSDPGPNAQDAVKAKLMANNWKLSGVSVDGVDKTSVYTGLTIQFTATGYSTTNGKAVWPATGTWSFTSTDGLTIKRDDGVEVKIEVTDTTLKMTLTWANSTLGGGRVESIGGVNVFSMVK